MRRITLAIVCIAALVLPLVASSGFTSLAVFVVILAIGTQGLNVVTGYAGQLSFGHAFFLGIGAYTAGFLGRDLGLNALIWIPAAGILAAIVGIIIAPTAVRLRGLYLAIVTIALVLVGQYLFMNLGDITGGPGGRSVPSIKIGSFDLALGQGLTIGPVVLGRDQLYYYIALAILALATIYVYNLSRSRMGRAMVAIHQRELSAAVLGINATRLKVVAFGISAFLGGIAGALYGSYLSYVQPEQWSLMFSVEFLAALVIGGSGTVIGPILGSIVVFALPHVIEELPWFTTVGGPSPGSISTIVYAVIVIFVLVRYPKGLAGIVTAIARRVERRREVKDAAGTRAESN